MITIPVRKLITLLAVGVCVALLASACSNPVSSPTAPTQTGPFTLAGVVSDGERPIEGANISAWIEEVGIQYPDSYLMQGARPVTDAGGRYQLTGLPAQAKVWLQVWKDGYAQQCAAPQVTLLSDTTADVQLVSKANLSASTGQTPAAGFRSVSGVIFGITGAGKQPVAGAGVYFDVFLDFPAAITLSDAAGRYLLCGLPEGRTVDIAVYGGIQHPGYASVSVPPGQSTGIDITLP